MYDDEDDDDDDDCDIFHVQHHISLMNASHL